MPPKQPRNGAEPSEHKYKVGDIVLCKLKGYPSWPGQVVDNDVVPDAVKRDKPPKGYRVCVQFFPVGDYTWAGARDVSTLTPSDIEKYLSDTSKKQGDLRGAYEIAGSPEDWRKKQEDNARARAEEEERFAQRVVDAEEDELASEPENTATKKRKRKEGSGKPKESPEESKKRKKARLNSLAKKRKAQADPDVESEDEAGGAAAPAPKSAAKPAKKPKAEEATEEGEKQAMNWRTKLQKCFFGKNSTPADADMPQIDEIFTAMEGFDMQERWLASSKLYKVLKNMNRGDCKVPRDEEFKFRERARTLLTKWGMNNKANGTDKDDEPTKENGTEAADDTAVDVKTDDVKTDAPSEPAADMDVDKVEDAAAAAES